MSPTLLPIDSARPKIALAGLSECSAIGSPALFVPDDTRYRQRAVRGRYRKMGTCTRLPHSVQLYLLVSGFHPTGGAV